MTPLIQSAELFCAAEEQPCLRSKDCIAFSELTEEEILAIADHEHIPEMVAAEMGNYLAHLPSGEMRVRAIIVDEIKDAARSGNRTRAIVLKLVLKRYLGVHPVAERRQQSRPGSC